MADIRQPKPKGTVQKPEPERSIVRMAPVPRPPGARREMKRFPIRIFMFTFIGIALIAVAVFAVRAYQAKQRIERAIQTNATALQALFPGASFGGGIASGTSISDLFRSIGPVLQNGGALYKDFGTLSAAAIRAGQDVQSLQAALPGFLFKKDGDAFLASLTAVRADIQNISAALQSAQASGASLPSDISFLPGNYLSIMLDLDRAGRMLSALIAMLQSTGERHLLVFFQNSAELRPTGGFIGSYADITIANHAVQSIAVHDITEADKNFKRNIVPPKPLQAIETRWHIANANWFFDFPTSAKKISGFMTDATGETYDGVLAVTPAVLSDLLETTGPVELPNHTNITSANVAAEIQKDVQARQAVGAPARKQIIADIAPLLMERMASLSAAGWQTVFGKLAEWASRKDLLVYFNNSDIEQFLVNVHVAGDAYRMARDFNGDYLAVVDTNVNGEKSDLYMFQTADVSVQVNADGTASDHLVLSRFHGGKRATDWWYRAPNRSYLQILTSPYASLVTETGGEEKKIVAPVNYKKLGYETDPDVSAMEASSTKSLAYPAITQFPASDKNVFATWLATAPGATSTLTMDYTHRLFAPPGNGTEYQFVFDRQPGVRGQYHFSISAPVGYVWQENNLPVYEYASDDPPGQLLIALTLKKI